MFAVLGRFNRAYEEAATDLGATSWQRVREVTLPILLPGIIGVALFGLTLSYDELARTALAAGSQNTLPLEIWAMTTTITSPALYAVGAVTDGGLLRGDHHRARPPSPSSSAGARGQCRSRAMAQATGSGEVAILGVTKRFGPTTAVEKLDLTIPHGSYCCLLGPSGCGKTTILRMIAGHETPTKGDIRIGGTSVLGLPQIQRGTAMMFQSYALFPHRSVLDNVAFALKMRGAGTAERHAKAARAPRPRSSSTSSPPGCRPSSRAASSSAWRWRVR